ncbi:ABC transporter ATP-binding protein [Bacillus thuringiensis]|uniref:ABC transporter ATP-binding protein n=1 Tax=Bacillus thuringiensis TaxID=1428 RepID=A0ABD6S5Y6_BACTU|nr:ABC transporter ATP-binding protein [Bacillus thuringiensis]PER51983.1 ABC transporter ATP-binding protein [Bacillus thuringiensis]PEU88235.1 ABC transporter ATP-binding protein [Bacillus thuringiensis]PFI05013.1 ABC transporter ATP-binding protein [Bacillus thuringiensis]PFN36582.1 ABC transporter ATP-binding protein [Bacillus thuringiensis]PFW42982.1 ABC transporter ATP-binding protein [Bacillus thuringiensis]
MSILEIKNLRKEFDNLAVLKGVNTTIDEGEIISIIGKNGAGKSTLINLIVGMIKQDSGDIKYHINKKKDIGVMLQADNFPENMKVKELIKMHLSFYKKRKNIESLLNMIQLENKKNAYIKDLSGGQKRRLSFLLAVAHDPKLIILDEPTNGMDLDSVENFWGNINHLKEEHKTILLVTHDLHQVDEFTDRVIILNAGEIKKDIKISDIKSSKVIEYTIHGGNREEINEEDLLYGNNEGTYIINPERKTAFENNLKDKNIAFNNSIRKMEVKDIFRNVLFTKGA